MTYLCLRPASAAQQRGNALIWALLGLIISGLGSVAYVRHQQSEFKSQAGQAEASVLSALSKAAHLAISEHMLEIQRGNLLTKTVDTDTITVIPSLVSGESEWHFSTDELRRMGYLPAGWNTATSAINGSPYSISFRRTPVGCLPSQCNIEGAVVLEGAISDPASGRSDATIIGAILTHIGVDAAVSLPHNSNQLTGYGPGGSWSMANPVAGNPAGVVAVRVGTAASAYTPFVRIGDLRDPKLAGNLTALGNLSIGGSSTLQGPLSVNGEITTPAKITAEGRVSGAELKFSTPVTAGASCEPATLAFLASGGLALCNSAGTYQTFMQYQGHQTACSHEGRLALDPTSAQGLICYQNHWVRVVDQFEQLQQNQITHASQILRLWGKVLGSAL